MSVGHNQWGENLMNLRQCLAGMLLSTLVLVLTPQSDAAIQLTGNVKGNPTKCPKDPCPVHPSCTCWSQLDPLEVKKIDSPTTWFQQVLEDNYLDTDGWNFHYVGGNDNLKGVFDVEYYRCYNNCPDLLGAEIKVDFVPTTDSLIQDVLWINALQWDFRCYTESKIDDRDFLFELGNHQAGDHEMYGPFYPYQDEDEDGWTPPRWQAEYRYWDGTQWVYSSYDYFYDAPGRSCPQCSSSKFARFETYATWWDDYFKSDGTIVDVGNDGHHVFIHEGFRWGVTLHCVPEPSTLIVWSVLGALGMTVGRWWRRRR